jgi:hypothetical protein
MGELNPIGDNQMKITVKRYGFRGRMYWYMTTDSLSWFKISAAHAKVLIQQGAEVRPDAV